MIESRLALRGHGGDDIGMYMAVEGLLERTNLTVGNDFRVLAQGDVATQLSQVFFVSGSDCSFTDWRDEPDRVRRVLSFLK